jgi:hypothetical protein
MEAPSLNVLAIKKIAHRKGCTVERTVTLKQRPYMQIYDAQGRKVEGGMALTLTAAKRLLEAMPDRPGRWAGRRPALPASGAAYFTTNRSSKSPSSV